MSGREIHTRKWNTFRQKVFATYGTGCWLCGHDGARTVDHVIPRAIEPGLFWELSNLRPAHGTGNRCPQCGRCCNQARKHEHPAAAAAPRAKTPQCGRPGCVDPVAHVSHGRPW